ncbi:hypothetical protein KCP70_24735 [Salmonella enterica subsp. enterica]|nr:hypothetical protein KCP70_24735 [Salmonella enterica subsp. enterica]
MPPRARKFWSKSPTRVCHTDAFTFRDIHAHSGSPGHEGGVVQLRSARGPARKTRRLCYSTVYGGMRMERAPAKSCKIQPLSGRDATRVRPFTAIPRFNGEPVITI